MIPRNIRITTTPIGYHEVGRIPAGTPVEIVVQRMNLNDEIMVRMLLNNKYYERRVKPNRLREPTAEEYELGRILFQGDTHEL